jgi:hypothetical protein
VAEAILGLDDPGTMIHDGWSSYDWFANAHQQCLNHLLRVPTTWRRRRPGEPSVFRVGWLNCFLAHR